MASDGAGRRPTARQHQLAIALARIEGLATCTGSFADTEKLKRIRLLARDALGLNRPGADAAQAVERK